jgi:hypothetical protein
MVKESSINLLNSSGASCCTQWLQFGMNSRLYGVSIIHSILFGVFPGAKNEWIFGQATYKIINVTIKNQGFAIFIPLQGGTNVKNR